MLGQEPPKSRDAEVLSNISITSIYLSLFLYTYDLQLWLGTDAQKHRVFSSPFSTAQQLVNIY